MSTYEPTSQSSSSATSVDGKKDDMPAARTLLIVVGVLLVGFAIVAAVMNFKSENDTLNPLPPAEVTAPVR